MIFIYLHSLLAMVLWFFCVVFFFFWLFGFFGGSRVYSVHLCLTVTTSLLHCILYDNLTVVYFHFSPYSL